MMSSTSARLLAICSASLFVSCGQTQPENSQTEAIPSFYSGQAACSENVQVYDLPLESSSANSRICRLGELVWVDWGQVQQDGETFFVWVGWGWAKTSDLDVIPSSCSRRDDFNYTAKTFPLQTIPAFLSIVAYAEGTGSCYNFSFSYKTFSSFQDHPRKKYCSGLCSDAAGRYQFKAETWDDVRRRIDVSTFSPVSQDVGALYLMSRRGVNNFHLDLSRAEFEIAINKLNQEWASFPNSPYGQPTKTMPVLWDKYQEYLAE